MIDCEACGSPEVYCWGSKGAVDEGEFIEDWQCHNCNSLGVIKGDADDPPEQWDRTGLLFEGKEDQ